MRGHVYRFGDVAAHLDAMTGTGLLVLPPRLGQESIDDLIEFQDDWHLSTALRKLEGLGWALTPGEYDPWIVEGWSPSGSVALTLHNNGAVVDNPSPDEVIDATVELAAEAGIWLGLSEQPA